MSKNEFEEELLNNPEFANHMISGYCKEIAKHQEQIASGQKIISKVKQKIFNGLETRKTLKQMVESEKQKRESLEATLQTLSRTENEEKIQFALLAAKQDEKTLKNQAYLVKYRELEQKYKERWLQRQAEYEKIMPLAAERRQAKIELQKLEIQNMILRQKKDEQLVIQQQKSEIDRRRLQVGVVKLVGTLQERSKKQEYLKRLIVESSKMKDEVATLKQLKQQLILKKAEEERLKLRARKLMPPPVLDFSFMSFNNGGSRIDSQPSPSPRYSIDQDNISINTIMFEEMCKNDDQRIQMVENIVLPPKKPEKITQKPFQRQRQKTPPPIHQEEPSQLDPNDTDEVIEALEKTYSQLSIEKEPESSQPMEIPVSSEEKSEDLNLKSSRKLVVNEDAPEAKKPKLADENEKKNVNKPVPVDKPRQLPTIKAIETINKQVIIAQKPLIAEVTPTPSLNPNLFNSSHCPASCVGSECSVAPYNTETEGTQDTMNKWGNFSSQPNLIGSEMSFMSSASVFKAMGFDGEARTEAFPKMDFFGIFPNNEQGESSNTNKSTKNEFGFF